MTKTDLQTKIKLHMQSWTRNFINLVLTSQIQTLNLESFVHKHIEFNDKENFHFAIN